MSRWSHRTDQPSPEVMLNAMGERDDALHPEFGGTTGMTLAGVTVVGSMLVGAVAMYWWENRDNGGDSGRRAEAEAKSLAIPFFIPGSFDVEVGKAPVNASVDLTLTGGDQVCSPGWTPLVGEVCPGLHATDTASAQGHSFLTFDVDFPEVSVITTRRDEDGDGKLDGDPLPEDRVSVGIDPTSLQMNSSFEAERVADTTLTIEGGMVVEVNGEELSEDEQYAVIGDDGEVTLQGYSASIDEGFDTDVLNSLGLGQFFDINEKGPVHATSALDLLSSDWKCDRSLREKLGGMTRIVHESAKRFFAKLGYNPEKVRIESLTGTWGWPKPEEVTNDNGETFYDRTDNLQAGLEREIDEDAGQAVNISGAAECNAERLSRRQIA